ncbi:MAG TPA: hypothetical protein VN719_07310, partial [Gemmatimonadales bacterium]|nr:hypothetical protein [Gemmatimonadales bacterium]
ELAHDGYRIIIFTTRGNRGAVIEYLQAHGIPFDDVNRNKDQPPGTSGKVIADVYVDDRAVDARPDWKEVVKAIRERVEKSAAAVVQVKWAYAAANDYSVYECPYCGGDALNGDPEHDTHFRGSARCQNCQKEFSVVGPSGRKPIRRVTIEKGAGTVHDHPDDAAKDTATPTEAQAQAGNYRKGKFKIHGFLISIENPKGSTRSGTSKSGKKWSTVMKAHYGYFGGQVKGADGDQVDVFIGPDLESDTAYIVNQVDGSTGRFDEHKVMLAYPSEAEARKGYLANYEEGWNGLGSIAAMPIEKFKEWLKEAEKNKPARKSATDELDRIIREQRFLELIADPARTQALFKAAHVIVAPGLYRARERLDGQGGPDILPNEVVQVWWVNRKEAQCGLRHRLVPHHSSEISRWPCIRVMPYEEIGDRFERVKIASDCELTRQEAEALNRDLEPAQPTVYYDKHSGSAYQPASRPFNQDDHPVIGELRKAKERSDRGDYLGKHEILRQLLKERPGEFFIDSHEHPMVGITHRPTRFRIHMPEVALPDEFVGREKKAGGLGQTIAKGLAPWLSRAEGAGAATGLARNLAGVPAGERFFSGLGGTAKNTSRMFFQGMRNPILDRPPGLSSMARPFDRTRTVLGTGLRYGGYATYPVAAAATVNNLINQKPIDAANAVADAMGVTDPSLLGQIQDRARHELPANYPLMAATALGHGDQSPIGQIHGDVMRETLPQSFRSSLYYTRENHPWLYGAVDTLRSLTPAGLLGTLATRQLASPESPDYAGAVQRAVEKHMPAIQADPVAAANSPLGQMWGRIIAPDTATARKLLQPHAMDWLKRTGLSAGGLLGGSLLGAGLGHLVARDDPELDYEARRRREHMRALLTGALGLGGAVATPYLMNRYMKSGAAGSAALTLSLLPRNYRWKRKPNPKTLRPAVNTDDEYSRALSIIDQLPRRHAPTG